MYRIFEYDPQLKQYSSDIDLRMHLCEHTMSTKDECLICGAPLKYLGNDELMECAICHKKENSKTVCERGHYICNECHTQGMDSIVGVCLAEASKIRPILNSDWSYLV